MRFMRLIGGLVTLALASVLAACGGSSSTASTSTGTGGHGGAGTGGKGTGGATCTGDGGASAKGVPHVIVVIQENHTFDAYFGRYCTAAAGSNPTCTAGPACCEGAPATEPSGASPVALDDTANGTFDPNHQQLCEVAELHGGMMDRFVVNTDPTAPSGCADPRNFAIATDAVAKPYHDLATGGAIADRYFQSIAGQSSSNDMYFAVAKEVFIDNAGKPMTPGAACDLNPQTERYTGQTTIADVLQKAGKTVHVYAEGYDDVVAADPGCPTAAAECPFKLPVYPCIYTPSDVPFLYYAQHADDPKFIGDYKQLAKDLAAGTLPSVSFVKGLGFRTEHPGQGDTITAGTTFVTDVVSAVQGSCYKDNTLILLTWDEGGGYFDHVPPPPDSAVDMQPYGTRVPLIAIGRYAKKGTVSHTTMEHSSIVKFLEFNFTGQTGQLKARDAVVNNIGSLLDEAATGLTIPD
jgi:phospholipase C